MKYYAGIGSRRGTANYILEKMTMIASKLEDSGYILRSGHAQGPDRAFEQGVKFTEHKEIFTAKHAIPEAIQMASEFHPYWDACDSYAKKLHGRNSMIILGKELDVPVKFVICYTPDGKKSGGTGLGMRVAEYYNIPIFNLYYKHVQDRFDVFLNIKADKIDLL